MKVKLALDSTEFYPMYCPASRPEHSMVEYIIEVDEEFQDRLIRVNAEFVEIQNKLAEMVEGAKYLPNLHKTKEDV